MLYELVYSSFAANDKADPRTLHDILRASRGSEDQLPSTSACRPVATPASGVP